MGSFHIINTFMKTFSQFLHKKTPNPKVTAETLKARDKFGSNNTIKKIGKGAPKGKQSLPGPKNRNTK